MAEEGAWGAPNYFRLKLTTLPRVTAFAAAPGAPAWEGGADLQPQNK